MDFLHYSPLPGDVSLPLLLLLLLLLAGDPVRITHSRLVCDAQIPTPSSEKKKKEKGKKKNQNGGGCGCGFAGHRTAPHRDAASPSLSCSDASVRGTDPAAGRRMLSVQRCSPGQVSPLGSIADTPFLMPVKVSLASHYFFFFPLFFFLIFFQPELKAAVKAT